MSYGLHNSENGRPSSRKELGQVMGRVAHTDQSSFSESAKAPSGANLNGFKCQTEDAYGDQGRK